jgi:hypothetical protein
MLSRVLSASWSAYRFALRDKAVEKYRVQLRRFRSNGEGWVLANAGDYELLSAPHSWVRLNE